MLRIARALSLEYLFCSVKAIVNEGILMLLEIWSNSLRRGTPRVTLDFSDTPAKWKVLRVICVAGSPILCAAIGPTISPGWTILPLKSVSIVATR